MKKHYTLVTYKRTPSGFAVFLDDKPALTPAKNPVLVPAEGLAEAVVGELKQAARLPLPSGEADFVSEPEASLGNPVRGGALGRRRCATGPSPNPLPKGEGFLHLTCFAIDLAADNAERKNIIDQLLSYADTDLLSHRAGDIPALLHQQEEAFVPLLAWARERFGVTLAVTQGLMPVAQPAENSRLLGAALAGYNEWQLAALFMITRPLSSLVLALALVEGRIDAVEACRLSQMEEAYETKAWGRDDEKEARLAGIQHDVLRVEKFLGLVMARVA